MKKPSRILELNELPAYQDNKWWIENATRIDATCQGLFELFFQTNEVPVSKMPDYTCVPIQCQVLKNHRFRFVIVRDDDGVLHLCILKYVEPPQHQKYFVLSYEILPSVKGASTEKVEKRLAQAGIVKGVVVSDSDPFNFNFYNTKEEARNMTTSKWRSKHGINKLRDVIEVRTSVEDCKDGLHALIEKWGEEKVGGSNKTSYVVLDEPPSNIMLHRVYLVNGEVVGYAALAKFCNNFFVMVQKHVGQLGTFHDKFITDHIGDFITYDLHMMLLEDEQAEALFYFGIRQLKHGNKESGLEAYKRKVFKRSVPYTWKEFHGQDN